MALRVRAGGVQPLRHPLSCGGGREPHGSPPWLKADSPSLPVDYATLLTTCCPGPPRSCGRRQRPAMADHSFDVGMVFEGTGQLRRTASHKAAASSPPSTLQLPCERSPHTTATFGKDWPNWNPRPRSHALVPNPGGQNSPFFASLFSLCRLLHAARPPTFMLAALTMQLPLPAVCGPPMYSGPHSGHCVVRPEYKKYVWCGRGWGTAV